MFLALRELTFARGRFALMGTVIALIAVLTVMLSGLASGLVNDGVSGLKALPVTAFAFDAGTKTDNAFARSVVDLAPPGADHLVDEEAWLRRLDEEEIDVVALVAPAPPEAAIVDAHPERFRLVAESACGGPSALFEVVG